jgi:DivIVA domain-containing protein
MPLFGKRKPRSGVTTGGWVYEPPPIEQMRGQSTPGATPPPNRHPEPTGTRLTPEDVRNVAFSKPPIGKLGYNEDEVDQFLEFVEAALRDPPGSTLTPEDVRNVAFAKPRIGKRGYNEDEVDAFLDRVEEQMRHRATGKNA